MENASKALIIAGAILLAILIIALGVFIFSKAKQIANAAKNAAVIYCLTPAILLKILYNIFNNPA